jgi:hypothetical protein
MEQQIARVPDGRVGEQTNLLRVAGDGILAFTSHHIAEY